MFGKNKSPNFTFGELELNVKSSLKYLGVIIDENLSFRNHVDSVKNKLLYQNYILLRVRQLLTREQMLLYYRTRVNPIIQYGVLVYGCAPFSNLQPIHRTQRRIMRTIFFLPKFANVQHLMASHELPTVYELHIYELINLIINAICEKHQYLSRTTFLNNKVNHIHYGKLALNTPSYHIPAMRVTSSRSNSESRCF